jgi:hypothetical protein
MDGRRPPRWAQNPAYRPTRPSRPGRRIIAQVAPSPRRTFALPTRASHIPPHGPLGNVRAGRVHCGQGCSEVRTRCGEGGVRVAGRSFLFVVSAPMSSRPQGRSPRTCPGVDMSMSVETVAYQRFHPVGRCCLPAVTRARTHLGPPGGVAVARDAGDTTRRCLLMDRLHVCTIASDHCGLLRPCCEVRVGYRLQWKPYEFFSEKLALERFTVHSDVMSRDVMSRLS